ncbi:ATP-binding protein [Streptomyces sp. NPDC048172]|uniref:ATP-binding protein n=1 Tax=Streptomyces sp. NPDC048172 TaxID=3365505 RepID=UPI00371C6338
MADPERLESAGPAARVRRILSERGIPAPRPEEPEVDAVPEWLRARRRELALTRWESATPLRYRRAWITEPAALAWADRVLADFTSAGALLLTGPTGTGKTHEAYGALHYIADAGPPRYEVITTNSADLYGALRPTATTGSTEHELRRFASVPLLLVDDLGSAKTSEWTEEITFRLIDHRYNHCLPTLLTSNLPARSAGGPDLNDVLGERVTSRLAEMTTVVAMVGEDRRRAQKTTG